MSTCYLILPRLQVAGANAMQSPQVLSQSPLMAAVMFGHNLGLKLDLDVEGVAYLHHSSQVIGLDTAYDLAPAQYKGASSFTDPKGDYASGSRSLSLQPTASMHLTVSLVIALDDDEVPLDEVNAFLRSARLAGGQIIEYAKPILVQSKRDLLHKLNSGFWLVDRRDLSDGFEHKPAELALHIAAIDKKEEPWLSLTNLGYALLSKPTEKANIRFGYAHAYSEALLGPVQLVPLRKFGQCDKDSNTIDNAIPFWHYDHPYPNLFLLKQSIL